jgi:hypothetical protein
MIFRLSPSFTHQENAGAQVWVDLAQLVAAFQVCWRRLKTEPPCRLKFEPGAEADFEMVGCG